MRIKCRTAIMLRYIMFCFLCALFMTNEVKAEIITADYSSPFMRIVVNAEVKDSSLTTTVPVYATTYAKADDASWKTFVFGAEGEVKDEFTGRYPLDEPRKLEDEHVYSCGEMFSLYDTKTARLSITYRQVPRMEDWGESGNQAEKNPLTPADAIELAQEWMKDFSLATGWTGLQEAACYAMPPFCDDESGKDYPGYYVVEFEHIVNGLPVARDEYFTGSISEVRFSGDRIQVWIDDQGIFSVNGFYRDFVPTNNLTLTISLDRALEILGDNFEFVPFHKEDGIFHITQVGLCYRLVKTKQNYDWDAQTVLEARPAWRFASAVVRQGYQNQFVLFVDAVTGEVLP